QAGLAFEQGGARDRGKLAREQERAPHELGRDAGRPREGVLEHAFERPLTELADDQAHQEVALLRRGAREELAEQAIALAASALAALRTERAERRVGVEQRAGGVGRGREVAKARERGPAEPDFALAELAREIRHRDR